MKRLVNVEIYGNSFSLRTDAEQEYVDRLSNYVSMKMKEIETRVPFKSTDKIALLTAFFIADEYFSYRDKQEEEKENIERRVKNMLDE